jgi:hypothetical protein
MKKITLTILTIFILTLTACGGNASDPANPASVPQNGSSADTLPVATQLIIGMLKLEDTNQAVTAEQAAELLPLWQSLQVLSDSDTAADQEKEALIAQIQETMTDEQMQAITAMNLTREDMFAIMQEQGMATGAGSQNNGSQSGSSSSNSGGGFGPGGGMPVPPDGGFPSGGPGFGPGGQGESLSPDQIATAQASRQEGSRNFIPPTLINALIEFLQEKAAS